MISFCGPSDEVIQEKIDKAVNEAINSILITTTSSSTTTVPTTSTTIFKLETKRRAWCLTNSKRLVYASINQFKMFESPLAGMEWYLRINGEEKEMNEIVNLGLTLFSSSKLIGSGVDGDRKSLSDFNENLNTGLGNKTDELCNLWYEVVNP